MDIESIPGVGPKTADALRELDDPKRALQDGDVSTLAQAPGVSDARAARIARAAIRDAHDDPGGFAATDRARELHDAALTLLRERTVTDEAAHRMATLYPSTVRSRIEEVREVSERAMAREPSEEVTTALADVHPLSEPTEVRVRERALATTDAETYAAATAAVPELSVELVDDTRQLADLAQGYATVIALDEAFAGVDVDGDVRVDPDALDDPVDVVPERVLAFFARNRDAILAAAAVHRAADLDPPTDLDTLEAALASLDDDGTPSGDDELQRLQTAVADLDAAVSMAENVANDHLREAIAERDVTIEGQDLLSLVEQGAGVDSLLSRELADEFDAAITAAREHVVDALALSDFADQGRRLFPDEPTYPVEADEDAVGRLREALTAARDRRAASRKRELAAELADEQAASRELVGAAFDLDVELAIARFAGAYDCTLPTIGGEGIAIHGGRSPLLNEPIDDVEPVDYEVSGVTILSGVNSGGKTSLLDLLGLVATLAHMGLPVPADAARVELIEELHYHAKHQGTLDAGAFEETLREFAELVTDAGESGSVLVLVDELESITEPGASAKIMAGILEAFADRDVTAVFVSHMAREIRGAASTELAVDGIEASGLEAGELVVDRSPVKGQLARSTPELIVEKLAEADDRAFYRALLEKFAG